MKDQSWAVLEESWTEINQAMGSLILCYHHINYADRITPEEFEENIKILIERGFKPIKLSEIYGFIEDKQSPPSKTVHITFDDGYADNYLFAFPILQKYGFYATIFVIANKVVSGIQRGTYDDLVGMSISDQIKNLEAKSKYISWEELKIMINSGLIEVGSHSLNHRACFSSSRVHKFNSDNSYEWFLELTNDKRLGIPIYEKKWDCATLCMKDDHRIRDYLANFVKERDGVLFFKKPNAQRILHREFKKVTKKYKPKFEYESHEEKLKRVETEVKESKKIIEENLGINVDFFCYPWGDYDVDVIYELQKNNYKAALTLNVGLVEKDSYPYLLPRIEVRNSKWLKKRLKIYSSSTVSKIYSKLYRII